MVFESLPAQKAPIEMRLSEFQSSRRCSWDTDRLTRASVRRELNAVASPVSKLPLEILTMIFFNAVLPPSRTSPFDNWIPRPTQTRDLVEIFPSVTLAAVCSSWRSVVLSTPRLWVYFEFPETLWTRKHVPRHLLSLYLHNSKHLPVHLSLSFSAKEGSKTPHDSLFHPSLDHALISNASRVYSLSLRNPPLCWLKQLEKMPCIVDLSMEWTSYIPETHDHLQIHRCRLLSRLSLRKIGKKSGPDYLPRLKSLSIRCRASYEEDDELGAGYIGALIESLERRLGPDDQFKLELSGLGVDWTPVAQRRLRRLVEKGIRLEIIEDSGRVDWLQPF